MTGLDEVREKLEEIKQEATGRRVGQVEKIAAHVSEALALLESEQGERIEGEMMGWLSGGDDRGIEFVPTPMRSFTAGGKAVLILGTESENGEGK